MLNDVNSYLKALDAHEIRTHTDALKFFNVRYSSFAQNYPKKCTLPGCLLAQHGFHYEPNTNAIVCFECAFSYDRLDDEDTSLSDVLAKHFQFRSNCAQAQCSLKTSLDNCIDEEDDDEDLASKKSLELNLHIEESEYCDESFDLNNNDSGENALKAKYVSTESRLKTFENAKMLLDRNKLAENGLFLVQKESSQNQQSIVQESQKRELTQIQKVAQSIPFLHHVKCAFCSYECLLFRNSLLNTYYKSPFVEHKEKYGGKCAIFIETYEEGEAANCVENSLDWLKLLYDFESSGSSNSGEFSSKLESSIALDKNVELKAMPKIIEHLVGYNMSLKQSPEDRLNNVLTGGANNNPAQNLVYMPKAGSAVSNTAVTTDFNQLQNVLNQTHNVMSGKAYSPSFTQLQARLDTFRDWPATLSQQPADLAKAGFYYFGIKDMVKCFFCNGGLKNWDHNDDPYEDHVRWFPKCQYVRQLMGVEYIEKVREKFKNEESGFNNNDQEASGGNTAADQIGREGSLSHTNKPNVTSGGVGASKKRSTSPRSLNSRLDTHIIRKILDNSILTRDSIKQSFDIKLSTAFDVCGTQQATSGTYADDFKSPVDLAMFAYDLDKAKTAKLDLIGSISDFIICNLPERITTANLREFIGIKYDVRPVHVRLVFDRNLPLLNLNDF
jgi:hypothetical protein